MTLIFSKCSSRVGGFAIGLDCSYSPVKKSASTQGVRAENILSAGRIQESNLLERQGSGNHKRGRMKQIKYFGVIATCLVALSLLMAQTSTKPGTTKPSNPSVPGNNPPSVPGNNPSLPGGNNPPTVPGNNPSLPGGNNPPTVPGNNPTLPGGNNPPSVPGISPIGSPVPNATRPVPSITPLPSPGGSPTATPR
jgi:hypothetical protein